MALGCGGDPMETCPKCGGKRVADGDLDLEDDAAFRPGPLRSFTFVMTNGVRPASSTF